MQNHQLPSLRSFFAIFSTFATNIEQAYITNEKRRAEALQKEKKAIITSSKNHKGEEGGKGQGQGGQGDFDRILAHMKTGTAFMERSSTRKKMPPLIEEDTKK